MARTKVFERDGIHDSAREEGGVVKSKNSPHAAMDFNDEEEEEDAERWWAFSTPQTIRALSKWISTTAAHMDETSPVISSGDTADVLLQSVPPQASAAKANNTSQEMADSTVAATKISSSKHTASIRPLCKGLDEFADFLDVQCGES